MDDAQILHPSRLGFFLEICHLAVGAKSSTTIVTSEVSRALQTTKVHHRHMANPGIWTGSIPGDNNEPHMSQADYLTVLSAVRHYVHTVDQRAHRAMDVIAEQHGGYLEACLLERSYVQDE